MDTARGSTTISNSRNYIVKKTFIEVVDDDEAEARSQERGRRSNSCSAAMDRIARGDYECGNSSTHSFDSHSRTSSSFSRESSAARQVKLGLTISNASMSSSDVDGESFGSDGRSHTFSCTDDDGEEGEEGVDNSWSTGQGSSERVIVGVGQWTPGAERHASGQCKPCHYLRTKVGCMNGPECSFCHMEHAQRVRPRPCKSARMKCKRMAAKLDQVKQEEPENLDTTVEHLHKLSTQSRYLQTVLRSKLRKMQDPLLGLEDGEAECSSQADQAVRGKKIISL
mmetsp:Transcript_12603/g.32374  ORF Transcript_12603/g.32374 Transcript_12603/m.32374 type:complete len:282 (+) Transcript_12603:74-919(+)